jgi:predicted DNA-binding transcriptional regulator AlpA
MKQEHQKRTITPREAAEMYGLNLGTLANYRSKKQGPKYYRLGKKVLYLVEDLEHWIMSNPVMTMES